MILFTSLFFLFVISCQGAQIVPYKYSSLQQIVLTPLVLVYKSTTPSCDNLANRVFYGGTGGDKYNRGHRYIHTNESGTEIRVCDCSTGSGGCCLTESLFSPFPEKRVVTSISYYYYEIVYYAVSGSSNIYGMRRNDTEPRTFIFGEEHEISEMLSVFLSSLWKLYISCKRHKWWFGDRWFLWIRCDIYLQKYSQ